MSEQAADLQPQHDGSIAGAVDMMPDIEALEGEQPERQYHRDEPTGRFAQKPGEAEPEEAEEVKADDAGKEAEKPAEEAEDDDDWLEIAAEEDGAEPQRLKVSEVYEGFQRAQQLEQEIANLKEVTPPPPDYDQIITETVEVQTNYLQKLQSMEQMLTPFEPDIRMLDENSPNYDPSGYFLQKQAAEQQSQRLAEVQQERQRVEAEVNQRQEAVTRARFLREQQKLMQSWPELKEEAVQHKVRDEASRFYGIDEQTLNSVHDARFYNVLKDALAYRAQSQAKETAVRAVKAKPKLVKGKARSANSNQSRAREAMGRLSQSGSFEDAADALEGLL